MITKPSKSYQAFLNALEKVNPRLKAYIDERIMPETFDRFERAIIDLPLYSEIMEFERKAEGEFDIRAMTKEAVRFIREITEHFSEEGYNEYGYPEAFYVHMDKEPSEGIRDELVELEEKIIDDCGGKRLHTFSFDDRIAVVRLTKDGVSDLRKIKQVKKVVKSGRAKIMSQTPSYGWYMVEGDKAKAVGFGGQGISIAIIDTGVDRTHEDLKDRYKGGRNIIGNNDNPYDGHGHGTHCAGIACASDNDVGIIGVAPLADLYGVKVLNDQGAGYWSDVAAGVDWASINDIDILSLSLGGSTGDATLEAACNTAWNRGCVIVAAAGNSGGEHVFYPAAYASVISVSALDSNYQLAEFSTYGSHIELTAPGVGINSCLPGNQYFPLSGTSMACPHVSGVAAVIKSWYPMASNHEIRELLKKYAYEV